jgi:MFS family permease
MLAALTFGVFTNGLQNLLVIPALPALERDLDLAPVWGTWLVTGFLLVSSIAAPILGRLGDQHGKRRMLRIAMACFFLGAVGAAVAPNQWVLILARSLQGIGGAIIPLSFSIAKDQLPPERLRRGVTAIASAVPLGSACALVGAGPVVDLLSWRYLFVIAAALTAAALVLVFAFVPESPLLASRRPDVVGGLLLAGGLVSFMLAVTQGPEWGWTSARVLALFVAAGLVLVAWGWAETRVRDPMIDMKMLALRPVLLANVTAMLSIGFAVTALLVVMPRFLAGSRGLPAAEAAAVGYGFDASTSAIGLYLLPWALAGILGGFVAGRIGRGVRTNARLAFATTLIAVGFALLAVWHSRPWQIELALVLIGAGFPVSSASIAQIVMEAVPGAQTGVATGMNVVIRQIGSATGGQIVAAILAASVIGAAHVPTEGAFVAAFAVCAAAAGLATVTALAIRHP